MRLAFDRTIRRGGILLAGAAAWALLAAPLPALAQSAAPGSLRGALQQQSLVDRATLTVQDMLGGVNQGDRLDMLRRARAVMICPRVFRAGFIFGGSGGDCVLVARDGSGSWSDPAFFHMGDVSFGLQVGLQDAEIVMMVLTRRGLSAIMDDAVKLGGDAQLSVATIGAGVEGATTAALRADIVAYTQSRGLYGGITVSGSVMTTNTAWNRMYYGQDFAARQIVLQMQANNPGADPLRAALSRYGAAAPALMPYAQRGPIPQPYAQQGPMPQPYAQPPYGRQPYARQAYEQPDGGQPVRLQQQGRSETTQAPIQQQSLPPPR